MSKENIKLFAARLSGDEELQQRMKELIGEGSRDMRAGIVHLARERGFAFTEDEMEEFAREQAAANVNDGELSDSQLEAVAGGGWETKVFHSIFLPTECAQSAIDKINKGYCHLESY